MCKEVDESVAKSTPNQQENPPASVPKDFPEPQRYNKAKSEQDIAPEVQTTPLTQDLPVPDPSKPESLGNHPLVDIPDSSSSD